MALHWITHGGNLLRPPYVNAPVGMSSLWNTSVLGLGLPAAPLTALVGPVTTYDVLVVVGVALNAWVMAIAAGRWVSRPAAVVAGAVFGYGAYSTGQAEALLHLLYLVYPVALALLATDLLRGAPARRVGVLVAVATVWQFFVSTEVLATTMIFGAVTGVVALALHPEARCQLRRLAMTFGAGLAGAAVVLAYPISVMWATPTRVGFVGNPASVNSANLANLIVPTPLQVFDPKAGIFGGNIAEGGLYLGIPLLLTLVLGCAATWGQPLTRVLVVVAGCMTVLSLGPVLHDGSLTIRVPLPWTVIEHLPLLGDSLPARLDGYVYICAAVLAGIAVDAARRRRRTGVDRALVGVLALACAVTLLPRPFPEEPATVPTYFTSRALYAIPAGSLVRTIPSLRTGDITPLLWQASAGLRYRTTGTFWEGAPTPAPGAFTAAVGDESPTHTLDSSACRTLRRTHTTAVLVDAVTRRSAVRTVTAVTGMTPVREGGMEVFLLAGSRCG